MPGKERDNQITPSLLANEFRMRKLLGSFGNERWKYSQFWADREGEFLMVMESPSSKKWIEYKDNGSGPEGSNVTVNFWDEDRFIFSFRQDVGRGRRGKIENHIIVGPLKDEYFHPEWGWGIHYWPDGTMRPLRNVKGLPRKIDMEKTVDTFIDQIINGKFGRPLLVLPKK